MGKAGDLDYARIVNDLGRDALLKNYTPSNVEVEEKETIVEPDVKEDKPNKPLSTSSNLILLPIKGLGEYAENPGTLPKGEVTCLIALPATL